MRKNLSAKLFCTSFFFLITSFSINAQVTTNSGSGLAATYPSLDAAITALNTVTITSPVVITLTAANPQTAPAGGYEVKAEGTIVNTIRIVGNNNTITASNALTAGNLNDGIFKIIGGDYISIENFIMMENAANLTIDAATNNMTEWGVALLYLSVTNGSQNNTIKGCTIDLNRNYQNTFGIYSNSNHSATAVSTAVPPPTSSGGNSGLILTNNSITDVNIGIVAVGPTPATAENDGLTIGGSLATANTITNFGTTGTFSTFANVSGTVNGILIRNIKNFTISHNTITSSNGGTIAGSLRGIFMHNGTASTGTVVNNINNNSISLKSAFATGAIQGISIETPTVNATTTLNINNNDFNNFGHTVAASGAINGIINVAPALVLSISNNTFTNLTVNTSGAFTFLSSSITLPVGGSQTVSGNSIVTAFSKTGDGGAVTLFTTTSNSPTGTTSTSSNNNFSNITVVGATIIAGWINRDGASTTSGPLKTVTNNTFNNWTAGTGSITALTVNASASNSATSGNTITNMNGTAAITGIAILSSENGNITSNNINGLSTTGAAAVNGISVSGTTGGSNGFSILKNKIYNLTANNAGGSVNGIVVSYGGTIVAAVVTIFNNLIGDLKAPIGNNDVADVVRGINITATAATSNINVYYNTVYLNATSSGTHFGTSAIFHTQSATATTAVLDLKNNILINTSTASGLGTTAAFRRSATGLENYATTSNNNIFFAGIPSAANVIYHNGTPYSTLSNFKTLVTPRETASLTENVPFISTTGSSVNFLHVNSTTPTFAEGRAMVIATITDDFDGNVRGTTPDIGADEFTGITLPVTLVNFVGTKQLSGNELSWTTATEINNQGFELLRSADGINFSKLQFIASKANNGNSSSNLTYSFIDKLSLTTSNYYRLKQIDKDGKTTFSSIVLLKGNKVNKLVLTTLYPNPATDKLNVLIASPKADNVTILVTDISGKILLKQVVQIVNGESNIQLNINSLTKGNYVIKVTCDDGCETATSKFIKL